LVTGILLPGLGPVAVVCGVFVFFQVLQLLTSAGDHRR